MVPSIQAATSYASDYQWLCSISSASRRLFGKERDTRAWRCRLCSHRFTRTKVPSSRQVAWCRCADTDCPGAIKSSTRPWCGPGHAYKELGIDRKLRWHHSGPLSCRPWRYFWSPSFGPSWQRGKRVSTLKCQRLRPWCRLLCTVTNQQPGLLGHSSCAVTVPHTQHNFLQYCSWDSCAVLHTAPYHPNGHSTPAVSFASASEQGVIAAS